MLRMTFDLGIHSFHRDNVQVFFVINADQSRYPLLDREYTRRAIAFRDTILAHLFEYDVRSSCSNSDYMPHIRRQVINLRR
jgi:hypothetical protein